MTGREGEVEWTGRWRGMPEVSHAKLDSAGRQGMEIPAPRGANGGSGMMGAASAAKSIHWSWKSLSSRMHICIIARAEPLVIPWRILGFLESTPRDKSRRAGSAYVSPESA